MSKVSLTKARVVSKDMMIDNEMSVMPDQLSPKSIRNRILSATRGDIGRLQLVYILMRADPFYYGIVNKLFNKVALCPFRIRSAKGKSSARAKKNATKLMTQTFDRINKNTMSKLMSLPYERGVQAWNILWNMEPALDGRNYLIFKGIENIPSSALLIDRQKTSKYYNEFLVRTENEVSGEPFSNFEDGSVLIETDSSEIDYFHMAGAARPCIGPWLLKVYTSLFWGSFNEVWGEPSRIARIPGDKWEELAPKVIKYLKTLGRSKYGVFTDDTEIELLNQQIDSNVYNYTSMISLMREEISLAISGEIQAGQSSKYGSNSKEKTVAKSRRETIRFIVAMNNETLRKITNYIVKFNIDSQFDPDDMPDVSWKIPRDEDRATTAQFFETAIKYTKVSNNQIREELDLDKVEDSDDDYVGFDKMPKGMNNSPTNPQTSFQKKTDPQKEKQSEKNNIDNKKQ